MIAIASPQPVSPPKQTLPKVTWDQSGNLLFWSKKMIEQEKQLAAEQERQRSEQAECLTSVSA